jgi:hypothetical protein
VGLAGLQADRVGSPGLDTPTEVVDSGARVTNPVPVARTAFVVLIRGAISSDCCAVNVVPLAVVPTVEGDFLDCCAVNVVPLAVIPTVEGDFLDCCAVNVIPLAVVPTVEGDCLDCCAVNVIPLAVVPTVERDFPDSCVLFATSLSMDVLPAEFRTKS